MNGGSRFITEQELRELNNQTYPTYDSGYSHGWKPMPMMNGMLNNPNYINNSHSGYYSAPVSQSFYSDTNSRYDSDYYQWGNNRARLPADPMMRGNFGVPYGGPFNGIDSFMYE